jgi:subtilisin-like proprotein convertase family protein
VITRFQPHFVGLALFALPLVSIAQTPQKSAVPAPSSKEAAHDEMRTLARQIAALRAAAAPASEIQALADRYAAISRSLGGDEPVRLAPAGGTGSGSVPHPMVVPTPCAGSSLTTTNFAGTGGAIAPPTSYTGSSFTLTVAGAGPYLWDVNLTTFITHTYCSDLDITLQSPAGTIVTISTDNGTSLDNLFNGTVWDDNANDPVTDHVFTNLVPALSLSPEGRLAAFRGEDPNGVWTLKIFDDLGGDFGNLASWALDIDTLAAAPAEATSTHSSTPGLPIPDNGFVTDTITFSGLPTYLDKVVVYLEVPHTESQDLDIRLTSPLGTTVYLTTDNGLALDNVFNGSTFDPDSLDTVTDHVYVNLVVATPLSPEGAFDNFMGQDPNGIWTLTVVDDLATDVGTLVRWDLSVTTTAPPTTLGVVNYPGMGGPLPDNGTTVVAPTVFTTTVSGAGSYLWDLDLTTAMLATASADLDVTLTSPMGTVVTITTDNGGTLDNVFNGTLWDDNVNDPVTEHVFTNLVVAPTLSPEGRLAAFRGENPNGLWTLTIADDAVADACSLSSWSLDVTTTTSAPALTSATFSHSPNIVIPPTAPPLIFPDVQTVSGLGTTTVEVEVYLEILHTYASDLDITLTSPAGTTVVLTTDNGAGFDNVYDGTLFDGSATDPATDHIYSDLVVVPLLAPEGSFDNFLGQDPNGNWTLTVSDDANIDGGTFVRWDLTIRTCQTAPATYTCTPGDPGINLCPCANPPTGPGRGCDNKGATGGASIAAAGSSSLTTPTLVFTTANENPTVGSVLIQGTAFNAGLNFGHGVRCTAGTIKRLYVKIAVAGSITAPAFPTDADIPTRSASLGSVINPGDTRYYSVYYRDTTLLLPGCPAPANQFNVTNTAVVAWQP